ncbi:MAG: tetratricopeptide repeat protein [Acidobacteria bacterium]|nr:tetratricopeptide repeat protein [Acidobacteriota bacterium]
MASVSTCLYAGDLRIPLPSRNRTTPVQELNRKGVEAVRKNQLQKAKQLFYRAYLFDPDDPFTLNNLGYVAELEGEVERAYRFYELAGRGSSDALVDQANVKAMEGRTVAEVTGSVSSKDVDVNWANLRAIRLLSQGRASEAERLLQQALARDPRNAFTINNYAVAREMEGDYAEAVKYYDAAAQSGSQEPVVVTLNSAYRGKPLSAMAAESAGRLRERMQKEQSVAIQVGLLNLRGVAALNRNTRAEARKYFEQAYKLNPTDSFTLNNRGYLAEMDGDRESALFFYEKARQAAQANARVGYATQQSAEGKKLVEVADENRGKMDQEMARTVERRREEGGPIELRLRNHQIAPPPQLEEEPQAEPPALGPPQPPVPELAPRPAEQPPPTPQP